MKRLTGKIRSFAYPMVGVVLVSSLWVMAAEKAKTDQLDSEYVPAMHVNAGMPTDTTTDTTTGKTTGTTAGTTAGTSIAAEPSTRP